MASPLHMESRMRTRDSWRDVVINWSKSNFPKLTDAEIRVLQTAFPTVEEFNSNQGSVKDAIVHGFSPDDSSIFIMDIPQRKRNTPDKYDLARERKTKLQAKARYALTKIANAIRSSSSPSTSTTPCLTPVSRDSITSPRTFTPPNEFRKISLDEVTFGDMIGEGSYGEVYLGTWRHTKVAIKKLKTQGGDAERHAKQVDNFTREAATMAKVCCHNNLVQFIGIICDSSANDLYFLTGYCSGGSLYSLLFLKKEHVSLYDLSRMAAEAAAGILHLHNERIIHRDIASRNLLLDGSTRTVKISDFGFARECQDGSGGSTTTDVGPVKWMAPESIRKLEYSIHSDVFSFGVLLFEMFQMEQPWEGVAPLRVIDRVCNCNERCSINEAKVPSVIINLIRLCWKTKSADRPSMVFVIEQIQQYAVSLGHAIEEFASPLTPRSGLAVDNYAYVAQRDDCGRGYDTFFESVSMS